LPAGDELLAQANDKAYVVTNKGTLVVMNNKNGKQLHSVNLSGVTLFAVNTKDSKIYIGDTSGRIVCIAPK